jgi:hypothetical protein
MRCRQCQRRFHPRARGKDEDAEEMESNED